MIEHAKLFLKWLASLSQYTMVSNLLVCILQKIWSDTDLVSLFLQDHLDDTHSKF